MFRLSPARQAAHTLAAALGWPARQERELAARLARTAGGAGLVVGVTQGGVRTLAALGNVQTHQTVELASLTKPHTALLLTTLAAQGRLDPALPLARQWAAARGLPASLTPIRLATHTSGLPYHPARSQLTTLTRHHDPYGWLDQRRLLSVARRPAAPGRTGHFQYSNLGYGLLAQFLGAVAGEPYPAALARHVLRPLGLHQTGFVPDPATLMTPRSLFGSERLSQFGGLTGAGGLLGSVPDLLTLLEHLMAGPPPRILTPPGLPRPLSGVASGWLVAGGPGSLRYLHGGTARGSRSAMGWWPAGGRGAAVLLASGPGPLRPEPEGLLGVLLGE